MNWVPQTPPPGLVKPGGGLSLIPARYAKAIASSVGFAIAYLEAYGARWYLVPACLAIAGVLGVYGVPNRNG